MSMAVVQLSFLSEALELDMGEKQQELQAASIDIALLPVIARHEGITNDDNVNWQILTIWIIMNKRTVWTPSDAIAWWIDVCRLKLQATKTHWKELLLCTDGKDKQ